MQDRLAFDTPELWQSLSPDAPFEEFALAWLRLQIFQIPGAGAGYVLLRDGTDLALKQAPASAELRRCTQEALAANKGVVDAVPDHDGQFLIAFPVAAAGQTAAAVGLFVEPNDRMSLQGAMRQLQWGVAWLRDRFQSFDRQSRDIDRRVLDLLAVLYDEGKLAASLSALVTELADLFDCDRVSLGFCAGNKVQVHKISHSASFERGMNLVALVRAAMEEAMDQKTLLIWPDQSDSFAALAAQAELAKRTEAAFVATVPLHLEHKPFGAITFERGLDRPFSPQDIRVFEALRIALPSVLDSLRKGARGPFRVLGDWIGQGLWAVFGPRRTGLKAMLLAGCAAVAALSLLEGPFELRAEAEIQGLELRSVSARYDGFIKSADALAGDRVIKGQVLASFDDQDLILEKLDQLANLKRFRIEHDLALGNSDPSELAIAKARIAQVEARLTLIEEQLGRTQLIAPFDALVQSGDLSQRIGSAVSRGEVLFELIPDDGYRLLVEVPDENIAFVGAQASGSLALAALPGRVFSFVVDRRLPVAEQKDGANVFVVAAHLDQATSKDLRAGMRGVARIEAGQGKLIWIWTRSLRNWARLALWRWI
ncbi:MAG: HlyD family efflux transporter periplasmic adaptor subunit [Pelagimonas sp.]|jgi:hypothetical protein|nr:HlyD family efflux transporter periplasmic adaptor subunit [Pelagimonas sp.]